MDLGCEGGRTVAAVDRCSPLAGPSALMISTTLCKSSEVPGAELEVGNFCLDPVNDWLQDEGEQEASDGVSLVEPCLGEDDVWAKN